MFGVDKSKNSLSLIYFWPAQAADDVLGLAAVDRDEGHLEADGTLQLLLFVRNLPLNGIQPIKLSFSD